MSLKEYVTKRFHGVVCNPNKVPQADWGCCGCGAPEMNVYITLGCDYCKASGDGYCWACVESPNWPPEIAAADYTVIPGRER
ncbi:hypothetical protein Ade02nite_20460 [Paractinoplanes deccanensis]|uniref:Uncharacterized protein n=1 Tax=Paractinoplanes deccanensis TaxID=113561 RepID=A0ABQ3Y097_9ACTN|nr:hypothetical protein [Actinoplanes deccanensis]GID73405.1 hypothetical protein Ade02nite_20460 [Actinoplanes deccanensis]